MNYKIILLLILIIFTSACNQENTNKKPLNLNQEQKYRNTGFALVYNDHLKKNKPPTLPRKSEQNTFLPASF